MKTKKPYMKNKLKKELYEQARDKKRKANLSKTTNKTIKFSYEK